MSANSSSPTSTFTVYDCLDIRAVVLISVSYTVAKVVLVLPLAAFVLYLGCRRRRRQQGSSEAASHSDFFTYHMAVMELVSELGWGLLCCGAFADLTPMAAVGLNVFFVIFPGQTLFHVLICLERYLAVVHPITYRRLKRSGGVRLRNVGTGGVWLLCGGWCGLSAGYYPELPILPFLGFLVLCLLVVTFCSVSVLRVLVRPGPGDPSRDGERVDQLKQKAFYTIMSIMAVLWLLFVGILVCVGLTAALLLNGRTGCVAMTCAIWFKMPSSLVSPLLFLHRRGNLTVCRSSA